MRSFPNVKQLIIGPKWSNAWFFLLLLIPNLLAALSEGASFGLILIAFNVISSGKEWNAPAYLQNNSIISWLKELDPSHVFTLLVISAIFLQILRSSLTYIGQIFSTYLMTRIQVTAQKMVFQQIFSFSFGCVSEYKAGDLVEYAKIPSLILPVVMDAINKILVSGLTILVSIWVLTNLSLPLTLFCIVTFSLFGLTQKLVISKISKHSHALSNDLIEFSNHMIQCINSLKLIHIFERQQNILDKTKSMIAKIANITKRVSLWNHSITPISEIMGISLVGIFLIIGQWYLKEGEVLVLPVLLTFITILHRLNGRVQVFLLGLASFAANWSHLLRLENILSSTGKEFYNYQGKNSAIFKHQISFRDVAMKYKGTNHSALNNLSFEITKGSTIAFVGFSGAGKSTIIDLLLRLYVHEKGEISVDDIALQSIHMAQWRNIFGVVSQDSFMFNNTIEENIRFGKLDATFEEIVHSARLAGAHDFIEKLPKGYQTILGERGQKISGGERQRIAMARALVRDPEILILDEATSNLDSYSEHCIQLAIEKYYNVKTVVIIAHRLSTIVNADKIYVLENGKILEAGTHDELLHLGGRYSFLWNIQDKKELVPS